MKNLICIFCLIFVLPIIIGSAPAEKQIELMAISITWDEKIEPVKMQLGGVITSVESLNKITFPRKKYPEEKLQLLVIPKDPQYAPIQILIKDNLYSIHLDSNLLVKINKDVIWLWGQTPKSHCDGNVSLTFRFLNKTSIFRGASGLFAWKITNNSLPENPVIYSFAQLKVDEPESISSEVFEKANQMTSAQCKRYHGGDCPFVFNFRKELSNRRFKVTIQKSKSLMINDNDCPI